MKLAFFTISLCMFTVAAYAQNTEVTQRDMLLDSYEFGNSGQNCSHILYNYGTSKWTVHSDDPDLLGRLYNACKTGADDKATGKDNLQNILDAGTSNQ